MITLKSSFEEILGETTSKFTEQERKIRWEEWKASAIKANEKDLVDSWMTTEASTRIICFN